MIVGILAIVALICAIVSFFDGRIPWLSIAVLCLAIAAVYSFLA